VWLQNRMIDDDLYITVIVFCSLLHGKLFEFEHDSKLVCSSIKFWDV
jgi:hypothetical protein